MAGLAAARTLASAVPAEERLGAARAVVLAVVREYWKEVRRSTGRCPPLRRLPSGISGYATPDGAGELARTIGGAVAKLDLLDAGYLTGLLYTVTMPYAYRATVGAYYTPPALCERLLDMAEECGVDWATARVLDPACGGGAFLAPVARRMAESLKNRGGAAVLRHIERRLAGIELDPFAGWLSQVFVDASLVDLYLETGQRPRSVVRVGDSLEQMPAAESFDLVVGNPPYGRVKLPPHLRAKFKRSLFGHANLYGVFTDLALRQAQAGGVVAYVTPTSFLAGEYFKALRGLLGREAPPAAIDFVGERKGVFADVLQETMLAVYRRGACRAAGKVHFITLGAGDRIRKTAAGSFRLPTCLEQPWLMPRTREQSELLRRVGASPFRLVDCGYTVSTGPLVWNRHRASLRARSGQARYPLLWAECVRSGGSFEFRAAKRNHMPYFEPKADERWVVTDFPCVLLQRTTAKEQCRRLIAAELPASFLEEHGAVVVENHLNMIKPVNGTPKVTPGALAALLNSKVVDQVFRCINGSVAVSAYELEALPLPSPSALQKVVRLVEAGAGRQALESAVEAAYGGGAA